MQDREGIICQITVFCQKRLKINIPEILSEHLDEVYDMIRQRKVYFVKVGQNFIINCKDVNSLFDKEKLSVAARNIDKITPDVEKEIALLVRED
jgi:hypothetical protein